MSYVGNGAVDTYSYTFKVFDQGDLLVTVSDLSSVETTLAIGTDYTVTGVGETSGGSVALVNASQAWLDAGGDLLTGFTLTIRRVSDLVQGTDIRNNGDFYPETHEDTFDKLVMLDQQQQDEIDRSVKLPETVSASDFDATLPSDILDSADKVPLMNATGDGFAAVSAWPTVGAISAAATNATSAAASAVLADASADLAELWATKIDGQVAATDYSSKAWAIGGTGVTDTASKGAAKEWAIETASTVDGTDYSAKEWAKGIQTRGLAGGGSAKDWASYTGGTVDGTDYSAKKIAQDFAAGGFTTPLTIPEVATPSTPASGFGKIYFKSDNRLYSLDDAGLERSVGGGGGGSSVNWVEDANAPVGVFEYSNQSYVFTDGLSQNLFTAVRVPSTYTAGSQINIRGVFYANATSNTVLFQTVATLIRTGTDAMSSTTNQRTSTNAAVTLATTANRPNSFVCDLTSSTGTINSVAVAAGDLILVQLTRGTGTQTGDATVPVYLTEVTFS